MAVDLGTSNTRVYVPGVGVALDEPSVIAMQGDDVLAAGGKAKAMIGRVPESVQVITPLRRGVIADVNAARHMLGHFIRGVVGRWHVRQLRLSGGGGAVVLCGSPHSRCSPLRARRRWRSERWRSSAAAWARARST